MNLKAAVLIALICFACTATTVALGISMKPIPDDILISNELQGSPQLCNGTVVEPTGEIDTPGGPTLQSKNSG